MSDFKSVFASMKPNTNTNTNTYTNKITQYTPSNATTTVDRIERFSNNPNQLDFELLKSNRESLRQMYIKTGKMTDPEAKYTLGQAPTLVAECMEMCPEFERFEREFEKTLHDYEKLADVNGETRVNHKVAVKRYKRSAAGDPPPLPCDVRPPSVLLKTLDYLLEEITRKKGLLESYSFVRDRARAIRNDLTLQNYRGMEAIDLNERIARYHILCSHVLCQEESVVLQQEHEQLRKTLQTLSEYYSEMAQQGIVCPNEPEFQAYYILTHAYSNDSVSRAERLARHVFKDPRVQWALEIHSKMARTNIESRPSENGSLHFYSFIFSEIEKPHVSYMQACCLHISFIEIRRGALKAMQKAYNVFPMDNSTYWPVKELVLLLGFDDEQDALETLSYYEIPVQALSPDGENMALIGKILTSQEDGKRILVKGVFNEKQRKSLAPRMSKRLIEAKRIGFTDVDLIQGLSFTKSPSLPVHVPLPLQVSNPITIPTPLPIIIPHVSIHASTRTTSTPAHIPVQIQVPVQSQIQVPAQEPAQEQTQRQIPTEILLDLITTLFNQVIQEILVQTTQEKDMIHLLTCPKRLIQEISESFYTWIESEILSEVITDEYINQIWISVLREYKTCTVLELIDFVVTQYIQVLVSECIIETQEEVESMKKSCQRFGWDRWRFFVWKNKLLKYKRQSRQSHLKRVYVGPTSSTPKMRRTRGQQEQKVIYKQLEQELHFMNQDEWMVSIPWAYMLYKSNYKSPLFKLCIDVPEKKNGIVFFHEWIFSKFIPDSSSTSSTRSTSHTKSTSSTRSRNQVQHYEYKNHHLIIQTALPITLNSSAETSSTLGLEEKQEWNYKSHFSGVNGAFYMLDLEFTNDYLTSIDYWKRESLRFNHFLHLFPIDSNFPLVLFFWTTDMKPNPLSLHEIIEKLSISVDILCVLSFKILHLHASFYEFNHAECFKTLSFNGQLLMDNAKSLPRISRDLNSKYLLSLYKPCLSSFQDSFWTMSKSFKSRKIDTLSLVSHASLFNFILDLFNHYLKSVILPLLTDKSLCTIPTPAREFVELKLESLDLKWNAPNHLQELKSLIESCLLPSVDPNHVNMAMSFRELHLLYSSSLSSKALQEVKEEEFLLKFTSEMFLYDYIENIGLFYASKALHGLGRKLKHTFIGYNMDLLQESLMDSFTSSIKFMMEKWLYEFYSSLNSLSSTDPSTLSSTLSSTHNSTHNSNYSNNSKKKNKLGKSEFSRFLDSVQQQGTATRRKFDSI